MKSLYLCVLLKNHHRQIQTTLALPDDEHHNIHVIDDYQSVAHLPKIAPGGLTKLAIKEGQYVVIVGTRFGNVVIYNDAKEPGVVRYLAPKDFHICGWMDSRSILDIRRFTLLLGQMFDIETNIGHQIERIVSLLKAYEPVSPTY